jgi:hypothetical protein
LLYRQIARFLQSEGLEHSFDIAFISIADRITEVKEGVKESAEDGINGNYRNSDCTLPPVRFPSGRLWISKEVIGKMADEIVKYIRVRGAKYERIIAYTRGSYLDAVRLAVKRSGISIQEIFTDEELTQLKKKGILWMKVGLRMPTPFIIFRMKIKCMVSDRERDEKCEQLSLF